MSVIPWTKIVEKLAGARVMLVGGGGFIGHNLALKLREGGVSTMVADNLAVNSVVDNFMDMTLDPVRRLLNQNFLLDRFVMMRQAGVELRKTDARHPVDLAQVFNEYQPTHVVHLSAIASAVEARKDPGLCFDLQLVTLRNVLELCRIAKGNSPLVMLMSSSTVYGDFETPTVDESTRPRPVGIYANTKFMAERLVRTYNHHHGLKTVIIRPSALYGERCVSRRVSQVFIENALAGKPLLLEGGGDGRLDFTYIDDLVEGIVRALTLREGPSMSETFNITFGNARTIAELAAVVQQVVPNVVLENRPRAEDKPIRGTLSIDRADKVLGFTPQWTLETGYLRYCQWYRDQWERATAAQ